MTERFDALWIFERSDPDDPSWLLGEFEDGPSGGEALAVGALADVVAWSGARSSCVAVQVAGKRYSAGCEQIAGLPALPAGGISVVPRFDYEPPGAERALRWWVLVEWWGDGPFPESVRAALARAESVLALDTSEDDPKAVSCLVRVDPAKAVTWTLLEAITDRPAPGWVAEAEDDAPGRTAYGASVEVSVLRPD